MGPFHHSPYVGYFRHSPTVSAYIKMFKAVEDEIFSLFKAFLPSLKVSCVQELADFLAGRLRGGSPWWYDAPVVGTSSTKGSDGSDLSSHLQVVSRIVGWILAPLLGDKESNSLLQSSPFVVGNPPRLESTCPTVTPFGASAGNVEDGVEQEEEDFDDDDNSGSDRDLEDPTFTPARRRSFVVASRDAFSSQAEANYAYQAARDLNPDEVIPSRLDFVITQMDIIRMQRNASRHLDVESIYQLPTVTYLKQNKNKKTKEPSAKSKSTSKGAENLDEVNRTPEEGWSWMLVAEQDQSINAASPKSESDAHCKNNDDIVEEEEEEEDDEEAKEEEDVCVICLEQFIYGDRLRVLPCGHSFHMGCIDRWLSGSASFEECHTAGCPMCKKRPTSQMEEDELHQEEEDGELRPDGSVPSWAFSQLGSALLERDSQQLYFSNA
ncbi:hypothetical protein ACA910_004976 [Epithemia clementina (nom. ined.)]